MILGFKTRFKQPILDGTKIHTIRADKPNRWHAGRKIQMATGVRTKQYECFKEAPCVSVQTIEIIYDFIQPMGHTLEVLIDKRPIGNDELEKLAKNDGFENASDLLDFFVGMTDVFTGKIIHWTNYKY